MKVNDWLRLIAGVFVLLSVVLGATVHPAWNYAAAFVAVNLIQSGFTGWCPMMALLRAVRVRDSHVLRSVIHRPVNRTDRRVAKEMGCGHRLY